MEDLCYRFPVVSEMVLEKIDDLSLIKFKSAIRETCQFLNNGRYLPIRMIRKYNGHFEEFSETWKMFTKKTPVEITKKLGIAVHQFFESSTEGSKNSALSIALICSGLLFT